MGPIGIASALYSLIKTVTGSSGSSTSTSTATNTSTATSAADFSSSLSLRIAALQAQSVNALSASGTNSGSSASDVFSLLGGTSANPSVATSGRNVSLFDPESAYRMMSLINQGDVSYKAQSSELAAMKKAVALLQGAGETLEKTTSAALDNSAIKTQLQSFTDGYNDWIKRFDGTVKAGGVLAGTQAATVSLNELEYSVENIFNGAKDGFHGLADLGVTIDPATKLASLDPTKLEQALATNRTGAANTIDEFAANFAKSAELLNSNNNFIPNRLANLDRVITYIDQHKSDLQSEFGIGAPAKISDAVARALAAYGQVAKV